MLPLWSFQNSGELGLAVGDLEAGPCYRGSNGEAVSYHMPGLRVLGSGLQACGLGLALPHIIG